MKLWKMTIEIFAETEAAANAVWKSVRPGVLAGDEIVNARSVSLEEVDAAECEEE